MTSERANTNEPVFRTPNPTELKEAAAKDPIADKYPQAEGDVNDEHSDTEKADDADLTDDRPDHGLTSDQTVKANISGH